MSTGEGTFLTVNDWLEKPRTQGKARQSLTAENSWPKGHYYYYKIGKWKSNYFLWVFICIKNIKFWCLLLWILVCKVLIFPILAGYAMDRSGTGSPSGVCANLNFPLPNYRLNVPTESQQEPGDAASRHHRWEQQFPTLTQPCLASNSSHLAKCHLLHSGELLFSMW